MNQPSAVAQMNAGSFMRQIFVCVLEVTLVSQSHLSPNYCLRLIQMYVNEHFAYETLQLCGCLCCRGQRSEAGPASEIKACVCEREKSHRLFP